MEEKKNNQIIKDNVAIISKETLMNKGLYESGKVNDKYCRLYINYRKLLDKYLLNKFSLKEYDDKFTNSNLSFVPVRKEDMDFYQYTSNMNLKYIYLRNNLYLEKLSSDDIEKVINLAEDELDNPSKQKLDIIDETYQEIIDFNTGKSTIGMNKYGLDYDKYWRPSDELVFGIRHDDFADNGLGEGEKWRDNNFKQTKFILAIIEEMKAKCSEIEGKSVNFIQYNEFTIKENVIKR